MPEMGVLGWVVVGLLAGALSGWVVRDRAPAGCIANLVIGVVGGLAGGFVAEELLGWGPTVGFLGALATAFVGAVGVRLVLRSMSD